MIVDKVKVNDANIYLIDTLALGNARTVACYLVVDEHKALIDMGYPSSKDIIVDDLASLNLTPKDIDYLIPTHIHLDHYGSLGYLAVHSGAEIVAHAKAVKHILNPARLISSVKEVFGEHALNKFGYPVAVDPSKSITSIESNKEYSIDMGSVELVCVTAEGHAPHQIAVYINASTPCIATADSVSMLYPGFPYSFIPTTPPPSFDYKQYIATVDRLRAFNAELLLMPHFGIGYDPNLVFDSTISSVSTWVSMIKGFMDDAKDYSAIEDEMIRYVTRVNDAIPEHLITSIRNSTKGIYKYLTSNPKLL